MIACSRPSFREALYSRNILQSTPNSVGRELDGDMERVAHRFMGVMRTDATVVILERGSSVDERLEQFAAAGDVRIATHYLGEFVESKIPPTPVKSATYRLQVIGVVKDYPHVVQLPWATHITPTEASVDSQLSESKWVSEIQNLDAENRIRDAVHLAITSIELMKSSRNYRQISVDLLHIDPTKFTSEMTLIALVRGVFSVRSQLSSWYALRDAVKNDFDKRGLETQKLLSGLF